MVNGSRVFAEPARSDVAKCKCSRSPISFASPCRLAGTLDMRVPPAGSAGADVNPYQPRSRNTPSSPRLSRGGLQVYNRARAFQKILPLSTTLGVSASRKTRI
ncbi:MAG: hypothetical protein BJ554DRAFT_1773 [Olpidium bornovanus]|uniref:Uncharacterized protein n=1 Tax=Olpidium bornovanus TaxID=278681 RepID=A0A8H7ZRS9_9FUNG|nr:MAG: hypothetical protein BJ554DRAFT_1773 [Olpidium bornovanus]